MTRDVLIGNTLKKIKKLPDAKIKEVNDFADFLLNSIEKNVLQDGIQTIISESKSYDFLKQEEDLYFVEDLKERYK